MEYERETLKIVEHEKFNSLPILRLAETDSKQKTAIFELTNNDWNRNGYMINTSGIDDSSYKVNPIVLWNHRDEMMLGNSIWPTKFEPSKRNAERMMIKWKVPDIASSRVSGENRPLIDFANEMFAWVDAGVLRGASQGIMPLNVLRGKEARTAYKEDYGKYPDVPQEMGDAVYIRTSELIEASIVPIPANRSTLKQHIGEMSDILKNYFNNQSNIIFCEESAEILGSPSGDISQEAEISGGSIPGNISVNVAELLRILTKKGN